MFEAKESADGADWEAVGVPVVKGKESSDSAHRKAIGVPGIETEESAGVPIGRSSGWRWSRPMSVAPCCSRTIGT